MTARWYTPKEGTIDAAIRAFKINRDKFRELARSVKLLREHLAWALSTIINAAGTVAEADDPDDETPEVLRRVINVASQLRMRDVATRATRELERLYHNRITDYAYNPANLARRDPK